MFLINHGYTSIFVADTNRDSADGLCIPGYEIETSDETGLVLFSEDLQSIYQPFQSPPVEHNIAQIEIYVKFCFLNFGYHSISQVLQFSTKSDTRGHF